MAITEIVTPAFLREYLSGVDFYGADDATLLVSDAAFEAKIDNAISVIETRLGISLRGAVGDEFEQQLDVMDFDPSRWHLHRLPRRPVLSIENVAVQYSNYPRWELPAEWMKIRNPVQGDIQLLPGAGNIRYLQGPLVQYAQIQYNNVTPAYLRVTYTYGFERVVGTIEVLEDETLATIALTTAASLSQLIQPGDWLFLGDNAYQVRRTTAPDRVTLRAPAIATYSGEVILAKYEPMMVSAVAAYAAIPLLEQLGIVIRPPGVTNQRVSIDSLSQGQGFNPRGPFAALIEQLMKQYDDAMAALENKWGRVNVFAV
jgi:hypothetical protein